jgi:hypothetical protein
MAELGIHRVTSVVAFVGEPQKLTDEDKPYAVTKIRITTKDGEEHQITLFGARDFDNPQTPVYPFVEMERPDVSEPDE